VKVLDWFSRSCRLAKPKGRGARHRAFRYQPLKVEALEERCLLTSYAITDLGTFGGTLSYGYAINSRGQAAGEAFFSCNCVRHPVLWSGGVLHDIAPPGQSGAYEALGLNDLGQVVGDRDAHPFLWSRGSGMTDLGFAGFANKINNQGEVIGEISASAHAFLWQDGRLLDLGTFDGYGGSSAYGINNRSEVIGQATGLNFLHAFAWTRGGGMRDLGTLDGNPTSTSGANAINDQGQIVGGSYSQALGTTHAVYFSPQGVIDLGTLGGLSDASAVNNLGQVVGDSYAASGDHAFLTDLHGGPMVDLNTLIPPDSGWTLFSARGINDAGQIVGTGQLPGYNNIHAYLLTPEDNHVVARMPVVPAPEEGRAAAADTCAAESQSVDRRPLPQRVASWETTVPPAEASLVSRSVAMLIAWAPPSSAAQGWLDPFPEAPACTDFLEVP
jgi:probable HAF family extracellular repeat protein